MLVLFLLLGACAERPDSHVPPFARVPYEPISRNAIASIALREWRLFGSRVDSDAPGLSEDAPRAKPERQEGLWQRVGEYWWLGLDHGAPEAQWTGKHDWSGAMFAPDRDAEFPWSAAFISYVMRIAGAGRRFPYAPDHAHYIDIAKRQALHETSGWLIAAEPPDSYAPKIGDLLCQGRDEASNLHFEDLPVGHYFPAHCDVVIDFSSPQEIAVIGGNERDAVSMTRVHLAQDGKLALGDDRSQDAHWLAILRLDGVPDTNPSDEPFTPPAVP